MLLRVSRTLPRVSAREGRIGSPGKLSRMPAELVELTGLHTQEPRAVALPWGCWEGFKPRAAAPLRVAQFLRRDWRSRGPVQPWGREVGVQC